MLFDLIHLLGLRRGVAAWFAGDIPAPDYSRSAGPEVRSVLSSTYADAKSEAVDRSATRVIVLGVVSALATILAMSVAPGLIGTIVLVVALAVMIPVGVAHGRRYREAVAARGDESALYGDIELAKESIEKGLAERLTETDSALATPWWFFASNREPAVIAFFEEKEALSMTVPRDGHELRVLARRWIDLANSLESIDASVAASGRYDDVLGPVRRYRKIVSGAESAPEKEAYEAARNRAFAGVSSSVDAIFAG